MNHSESESPPTQMVELVLGFTQAKPKLTVEQLLEIESFQKYVKTPLQTLDGIYIHQPKRFLPLAKEAKKLTEAFKKEHVASQWAGILYEKLLQESFVEQLNCLQTLKQLVPLKAVKEHLPKDIINILKLLGKADNIPFNQLYSLAEECADRCYTKVIKTLTQLLKNSFNERQLVLVYTARALKFLELYATRQTKLWKVLSKYDKYDSLTISMIYKLHCKQSLVFCRRPPLKTSKIYKTLLIYNKPILHHSTATLTPSIPNWFS